jgi:hypothetical protein
MQLESRRSGRAWRRFERWSPGRGRSLRRAGECGQLLLQLVNARSQPRNLLPIPAHFGNSRKRNDCKDRSGKDSQNDKQDQHS